jgi:quercetin dioxygenase-like cupin family protein
VCGDQEFCLHVIGFFTVALGIVTRTRGDAERLRSRRSAHGEGVPWHYHNNIQDAFYVVEGALRIFLQKLKESVRPTRGQT